MHFIDEKNPQKICLSQKCCTFAPSNEKNDRRSLILGYGVMVTQQILVLFFLVRVRVAQLHCEVLTERISHQFGLWCNGNTTDSGPVFLGSSPSSPTKKEVWYHTSFFVVRRYLSVSVRIYRLALSFNVLFSRQINKTDIFVAQLKLMNVVTRLFDLSG